MVIVVRRRPRWYTTRSSPRSQAGRTLVSSSSLLPFLFLTSSSSPDPALAYPENDQGSSCVPDREGSFDRDSWDATRCRQAHARRPSLSFRRPERKHGCGRPSPIAAISRRKKQFRALQPPASLSSNSPSRIQSPPGAFLPSTPQPANRSESAAAMRARVCVCLFPPVGFLSLSVFRSCLSSFPAFSARAEVGCFPPKKKRRGH